MQQDAKQIRQPPTTLAPLLIPALGFVLGIIAENLNPNLTPAIILAIIAITGYFVLPRKTLPAKICIALLAFSAGMIHHYKHNHILPANHIKYFAKETHAPNVKITGTIISPPIIRSYDMTFPYHSKPNTKTRFLIEARKIKTIQNSYETTGLVLINIMGINDRYKLGQKIEITGRLKPAYTPPQNPLFPNRKNQWNKHNKIFATMFIIDSEKITIKSDQDYSPLALISRIRRFAHSALLAGDLPAGEHTSALLDAVILGKRYRIENKLNEAFVKIGAAHFLAVSGFHLAVLTMGIWFIAVSIGIPRRYIALMVIGTAMFYLIIAGFRPAILRATIMVIIIATGILLNKQTNILNSISAAAILMLLWNPNQVFNAGFQLSFVSIIGIILLTKPIFFAVFRKKITTPQRHYTINTAKTLYLFITDRVKMLICVSLAAAISASPLVMYHFHIISLIGPLSAVLLVIPACLLIIFGFGQLLISILIPQLSAFISPLTSLAAQSVSGLAFLLSGLPGVFFSVPAPAWWIIVSYYVVIFYRRKESSLVRFRVVAILILTIAYLTTWIADSDDFSREWIFANGKITAVCSGNDLAIIDCGSSRAGQAVDTIDDISRKFLLNPNLAIITSPNQCFFNDIWSLKSEFRDMKVFIPQSFTRHRQKYQPVDMLLNDKNLEPCLLPEGAKIRLKNLDLTLYADGAVVLVEVNGEKVLVSSVLSSQGCRSVMQKYPDLRSDVLIFNSLTTASRELKDCILELRVKRIIITGRVSRGKLRGFHKLLKSTGVRIEKSPSLVEF